MDVLSPLDDTFNFFRKFFHAERFLNKSFAATIQDVGCPSFDTVTARQDNGHGRIYFFE